MVMTLCHYCWYKFRRPCSVAHVSVCKLFHGNDLVLLLLVLRTRRPCSIALYINVSVSELLHGNTFMSLLLVLRSTRPDLNMSVPELFYCVITAGTWEARSVVLVL